jgi:hypothetical protein
MRVVYKSEQALDDTNLKNTVSNLMQDRAVKDAASFMEDLSLGIIEKFISNILKTNPFELHLIENNDWQQTSNGVILYRSDLRKPEEIFQTGLYPKNKKVPIEDGKFIEEDGYEYLVALRKRTSEGAIDILPGNGVSFTEKASYAPYFPCYYILNETACPKTGKGYIYVVNAEKYYKAHEYERSQGSLATAAFHEVVCEYIESNDILACMEVDVLKGKIDEIEYKFNSIIFNHAAIQKHSDKKEAVEKEFNRLSKYKFLQLKIDSKENRVKVEGSVTSQPSTKLDNTKIETNNERERS